MAFGPTRGGARPRDIACSHIRAYICTGAEHTWHAIPRPAPRTHASPCVGLRSFPHEGSSSVCGSIARDSAIFALGPIRLALGPIWRGMGLPAPCVRQTGVCKTNDMEKRRFASFVERSIGACAVATQRMGSAAAVERKPDEAAVSKVAQPVVASTPAVFPDGSQIIYPLGTEPWAKDLPPACRTFRRKPTGAGRTASRRSSTAIATPSSACSDGSKTPAA